MAKGKQIDLRNAATSKPEEGESREIINKGEKAIATGKTRREITSLDELVDFFRVDLNEWEIERWSANQWQVGANIDGEIVVTPLYQVKAWLRRRTELIAAKDGIKEALEDARAAMKSKPWKITPRKQSKPKESLLVMAIMDPHFGKLCWGKETGWEDYNVEIARKCMTDAVEDLLSQAQSMPYGYEEILLPIGNDFFHVDNGANTTTAGTPQDADGRRQMAYRAGRQVLAETIRHLAKVAPVRVSVVPGNHDEDSMFCLGDALEMYFEEVDHITVDNSPKLTKYHEFGNMLIGMNHGKDIKMANLPSVMASECSEIWGRTKFREWFLGHWHGKGETVYAPVAEQFGVRVRKMSSLTPADAWHARKGYIGNVRAAEALVYHRELGYRAQFSHIPVS